LTGYSLGSLALWSKPRVPERVVVSLQGREGNLPTRVSSRRCSAGGTACAAPSLSNRVEVRVGAVCPVFCRPSVAGREKPMGARADLRGAAGRLKIIGRTGRFFAEQDTRLLPKGEEHPGEMCARWAIFTGGSKKMERFHRARSFGCYFRWPHVSCGGSGACCGGGGRKVAPRFARGTRFQKSRAVGVSGVPGRGVRVLLLGGGGGAGRRFHTGGTGGAGPLSRGFD